MSKKKRFFSPNKNDSKDQANNNNRTSNFPLKIIRIVQYTTLAVIILNRHKIINLRIKFL